MPARVGASRSIWNSTPANKPILDVFPGASGAYSTRRLSSSFAGAALRIRRTTPDTTELDIGFDVKGNLDTAALLAFCGAGNGFVSIWYDQSGRGGDYAQGSASGQPRLVNSGSLVTTNGKLSLQFDGVNDSLLGNAAACDIMRNRSSASGFAVHSVTAMSGGNAPVIWFFSTGVSSTGSRLDYLLQPNAGSTANRTVVTRSLDANSPISRNTPSQYDGSYNLSSITMNWLTGGLIHRRNAITIDAPTLAITTGNTSDTASMITTFGALNAQQYITGTISELLFYPSAVVSPVLESLESIINSYYSLF